MLPDVSGQYRSVPGQSLRGDCGLILRLHLPSIWGFAVYQLSTTGLVNHPSYTASAREGNAVPHFRLPVILYTSKP